MSEPGPDARTGLVIWFTGRPAAGKSTLAAAVRARLAAAGIASCMLDSDDIRGLLVPQPGYDELARAQLYATLGKLAAYLAGQGLVVLVPATAHRRAFRDQARAAAPAFVEVYVAAGTEECAQRDVKGLYRSAAAGELHGLPGLDTAYEEPAAPDLTASGGHDSAAIERVLAAVRQHIGLAGSHQARDEA